MFWSHVYMYDFDKWKQQTCNQLFIITKKPIKRINNN